MQDDPVEEPPRPMPRKMLGSVMLRPRVRVLTSSTGWRDAVVMSAPCGLYLWPSRVSLPAPLPQDQRMPNAVEAQAIACLRIAVAG